MSFFMRVFGNELMRWQSRFRKKVFVTKFVIGTGMVYKFNEEEEVKRPDGPIEFPKLENLTSEFLIRQSCALSSDQVL